MLLNGLAHSRVLDMLVKDTISIYHGIEMKIPIQSGNVSKSETIEPSIVSARTGKVEPFVREIRCAKDEQIRTKRTN